MKDNDLDASKADEYLDELRLIQRELGRAGEQMGWWGPDDAS